MLERDKLASRAYTARSGTLLMTNHIQSCMPSAGVSSDAVGAREVSDSISGHDSASSPGRRRESVAWRQACTLLMVCWTQPQPLLGLAGGGDPELGGMPLEGPTAARAAAALLATAVATAEAVDAEDACADPGPAHPHSWPPELPHADADARGATLV